MSNHTDFEERLRSHLAAKADLIDVPDHKFVQTKVIPFQPRHRITNLVAVAAGIAIVAMLGFGLLQSSSNNVTEAGILGLPDAACSVAVIPGDPPTGLIISVDATSETFGPTSADTPVTIKTDSPYTVKLFGSDDISGIPLDQQVVVGSACDVDVRVNRGETPTLQVDGW